MLRPSLRALILLIAFFPLISQAGTKPADVSGVWTWTMMLNSGKKIPIILTLKQDGEKLTGTYHGKGADSDIFDASIHGNSIAFTVVREVEGLPVTFVYSGKVNGDSINGGVDLKTGGRERKQGWQAQRGAASGN